MCEKIPDAIQPEMWYQALPRAGYAGLELVKQPEAWFSVYRLPGDVYAIYEPGHFQEVISFLVLGDARALLIDTGMGIGNIKNVTDFLCRLPLFVVNTHSHFDHIGGNHQYNQVHIYNHPAAVRRMKEGLSADEVRENMQDGSNAVDYPPGFERENYSIKPCACRTIEAGHVFDLGNRKIEVIATPGHSGDSIMLFDTENKLLFTGDTFYPATLYAHFDTPCGLGSDLDAYHKTLSELAERFADYTLICSHNEPIRPGSMLRTAADAFAAIKTGGEPYELDESGLKKYKFDGFCIVVQ